MNMHPLGFGNAPESRTILGVKVASLGWDEAIGLFARLLADRRFTKVSFLNAHNANTACSDANFAAALGDFLILPDGVGVDLAARILYDQPFPANLNGTDFIPAFLQAAAGPLTIGLLGAIRRNAEAACAEFAARAPQHRFVVIHDGFFPAEAEPGILRSIAALKPDILLVAMGVPRQEMWISRRITAAHCTMPIAVGALLDFMSGSVPRAPRLMRQMRLEWVFRLIVEPSRLWRRYILGNPVFLLRVLRQKLTGAGGAP